MTETQESLGLPADYESLTREGQRQARVALVQRRETPAEFVAAWHFFREYYLRPDEDGRFDPGFYDHWVDPAPGHYEWAWVAAQYPRLIETAHRGSAKSTIFSKEFPLIDLVTQPRSSNFIILSSDDKIQRHTDKLMQQIDGNKRIRDDFGRLRPKRTEGLWNHHNLRLTNGAQLVMGTINSMNLRGERPGTITLDDVERDPKSGTNLEQLLAQTDLFFFQVILPMARAHCKVRLIGTPNNKKTLIWRLQNDGDPRIEGSRFHNCSYWFFNKDGTPFWPAEYPTKELIEEKKKELGPEVWAMEMLGEVTAGNDAVLQVDPVKNEYDIDDPSAFNEASPLDCNAVVSWNDSTPATDGTTVMLPRKEVASKFFRGLYRFITVDYASTVRASSDYSTIQVFGVDRLNQMFSLDMWGGKLRTDELVIKIWEMARRWLVKVVGVEAVALQIEFYARVAEKQGLMQQGHWMPQTVPIRYKTNLSKPERISACRWRFNQGTYKLPRWRKNTHHYRELYAQIHGFNPNPTTNSTGLGHDDYIDTIPMAQELVGGRRSAMMPAEPTTNIPEAIRRGKTELVKGVPIGTMIPLHQMPQDCLEILMARSQETDDRKIVWESGGF